MIGAKLLYCFIYLLIKKPGYLEAEPENFPYLKLLENINPKHVCPECKVLKTPRSRHCNVCGKCVERYDNHCFWINSCVGVKNHAYYLSFVWFVWLDLLLVICIAMDGNDFPFNYCSNGRGHG